MGGSLTTPTAPQMTDVIPNRWGEPVSRPKGTLQGGEEVRPIYKDKKAIDEAKQLKEVRV